MKTLTVTFESGKERKYNGTVIELMSYRMRIRENEERQSRLGIKIDKAIKFETTDCIY